MALASPIAEIVARFDALDVGDLQIGLCTDGSIIAWLPDTSIRSEHICKSFTGYGDTADAAILDLWRHVEELEHGDTILTKSGTSDRAEFKWNGAAWKRGEYHEHAGAV